MCLISLQNKMRGYTYKRGGAFQQFSPWSDEDVINTAVYGKTYGLPLSQKSNPSRDSKFNKLASKFTDKVKDSEYRKTAETIINERGLQKKFKEAKTWAPAGAEEADNTYKPPAVAVSAPFDDYNGEASMGADSSNSETVGKKSGKRSLKIARNRTKEAQGINL